MIYGTKVIAGLNAAEARDVLQSGDDSDEFRAEERRYQAMGIQSDAGNHFQPSLSCERRIARRNLRAGYPTDSAEA
jgi:Predicted dithiol-disulfide isomerase involved in polyketide biosynthesis